MILEVAVLDVRSGSEAAFEAAFAEARPIIASSPGYLGLELQRCLEKPSRYVLLVRWRRVEDHTEGFRGSRLYLKWKQLLHHFYDPFPTVEHYRPVEKLNAEAPCGLDHLNKNNEPWPRNKGSGAPDLFSAVVAGPFYFPLSKLESTA
jgi:heme-degrading monooxygenase HmoA